MLRELMDQNVFFYGMIAAGVLGLWCLIWSNRFYEKAIRDVKNLPEVKGSWMKNVLLSYQERMQRGQKVANTEAFIRAELLNSRTLGLPLHKMKRVSGYMAYCCMLLIGAAAYSVYRLDYSSDRLYPSLFLGIGIVGGLLLLKQTLAFGDKEDMLLDGWIDYLENQESPLYEAVESDVGLEKPIITESSLDENDRKQEEEMIARVEAGIRQTAATESRFSKMLSPEEESVIREVIREYLT